jgi:hypothetical protein
LTPSTVGKMATKDDAGFVDRTGVVIFCIPEEALNDGNGSIIILV